MKLAAIVYIFVGVNVFGLVASNHAECKARAYDVARCSATTAIPAAIFWPLYASWSAYDALEKRP